MIYLFGFTLSMYALLAFLNLDKIKKNTLIFTFMSALLFFYLVLNRVPTGDTVGYLSYFNSPEKDLNSPFEYGFILYNKFFRLFGSDSLFLVSFPVILLFSLRYLHLALNHKTDFSFYILTFLTPIFLAYSVTGFRQSLSMSLGTVAIAFILKNKIRPSFVCLFIAFWFHSSSLIYLVPALILIINPKFEFNKYLVIWCLSIPIGASEILSSVGDIFLIDTDYSHYLSGSFGQYYQSGIRLDFILFSIIPLLLYFYLANKKLVNVKCTELLKAYLILNSIANMISFIPYSDRVYVYSWLLIPVYVSSIFKYLPNYLRSLYILGHIGLFYFYSLFWLL